MKFLTSISLGIITASSLFAQTTMCFKENHPSMSTIETTPLDGGVCASTKSISDMKKDGWRIEDIKIENSQNGKNYIYILKRETQDISSIDEKRLEEKILKKLEDRKKQEIAIKKVEIKQKMSKDGKQLYISMCQKCHGEKANKKAYNTSRPLVNLNYSDMKLAIRDYVLNEYDRGRAILMKPYAIKMTSKDIKNVYSYIQTLKPSKEEETK